MAYPVNKSREMHMEKNYWLVCADRFVISFGCLEKQFLKSSHTVSGRTINIYFYKRSEELYKSM